MIEGIVKLTSGCPHWWGLTALDIHFESQCLPTPLAWYAHHLPKWFLRLSVVGTLVVEIALPFLFFVPIKNLRWFTFISQVCFLFIFLFIFKYLFANLYIKFELNAFLDHFSIGTDCKRKL